LLLESGVRTALKYKLGSDVGVPSGFYRPIFEKLSILAGFSWESTQKHGPAGKNKRLRGDRA
jgi:hypothetical protein